jgi:amino acid transporter
MAFIFATYARALYDPLAGRVIHYYQLPWNVASDNLVPQGQLLYAGLAVVVLTVINAVGVREGKWTQNALTIAKMVGLAGIVVVAFFAPPGPAVSATGEGAPLGLALILVLFAFGGWNEMAYVAAEVKNPERNIVRALVVGTTAVTVLYLLANGAFLYTLGHAGVAHSKAVATDTVSTVFPQTGARMISALICISALGATNGLIFAGARISYAMGADHRLFRSLGSWHKRTGTPLPALVLQGLIALGLILVLGNFVNAILYTAAAVYSFYLATNLAVVVLRYREPHVERPYRVTGYPITTLIFCVACGYLIYRAVDYKPMIAVAALSVLLCGVPLYFISNSLGRRPAPPDSDSQDV